MMAPRIGTSPARVIQSTVLDAWRRSSLSKVQVSRAVPSISKGVLYRYLDGDRKVYMRERSVEAILELLESGPRGPKPPEAKPRKHKESR